jgi:hypothetical protein
MSVLKHSCAVRYFVEICGFAICRLKLKICWCAICWLTYLRHLQICDCWMSPRIWGFAICGSLFAHLCKLIYVYQVSLVECPHEYNLLIEDCCSTNSRNIYFLPYRGGHANMQIKNSQILVLIPLLQICQFINPKYLLIRKSQICKFLQNNPKRHLFNMIFRLNDF